ncbi:MAG: hypothetical protein C0615_01860 [Desulfuromonas sp.]|nr:MAG: hypothetical protein C0615_01860 [Desulfuromonas sp.]
MKTRFKIGLALLAISLFPQIGVALTVSDGGTLNVDEAITVSGSAGITAKGDGNTINITSDGSITSDQDAITTDGNDQTIINEGTISGAEGINFCFSDTYTFGNDHVINSGTIEGTSGNAISLGYGDDVLEIKSGSTINGDITLGPGDDLVKIKNTDIDPLYTGEGNDTIETTGTLTLITTLGKGDDTIHVKKGTLSIDSASSSVFGDGGDHLIVDADATLNILDYSDFFAGGSDKADIYGKVIGKLPGGPDSDTFNIYEGAQVEDLCGGSEDDKLNLYISGDYDYDIDDFETVNKYGEGTLTLTASSNGSGNDLFFIHEGALVLNGSLSTNLLFVKNGAELGGNGFLSGDLFSSGVVAPRGSSGTLSVSGDYTQRSDGQLSVSIGGGVSNLLAVTGTATIDGSVDINISDKLLNGETYTFLTTLNGLTGTFRSSTKNAFFDLDVSYDANNAYINVTELSDKEVGLIDEDSSFIDMLKKLADGGNTAAADTLGSIINSETTAEAHDIMGSLSPEQYPNLIDATMVGFKNYNNSVVGRMGSLHLTQGLQEMQYATNNLTAYGPAQARIPAFESKARGWSSWGKVLGMSGEQDSDSKASGYDFDTYGLSFGFDNKIADSFVIGIGGGYADSDVDFKNAGQSSDVESLNLGLYGTYSTKHLYIDTAVFYASNDYDSDRVTSVVNATSSTDGTQWGAYLGGGYTVVDSDSMYVITNASVEYSQIDIDGFSETGTGLLYSVSDFDADSTVTTLGLRIGGKNEKVEPEFRLAWAHEFGDTERDVTAGIVNTSTTFAINGVEPDEDSCLVGLGINYFKSDNFTLFVDYDGEFRSGFDAHAISGGLRYNF